MTDERRGTGVAGSGVPSCGATGAPHHVTHAGERGFARVPDAPHATPDDDTPAVTLADVPAAVLEALPDGVYLVDRKRTVTYWNAAAEKISGYPKAEVVGRWCGGNLLLSHVDEDGRRLCGDGCPLLATMEDGRSHSARVLLHHREGHLVPVEVRAAALRNGDGAIVGAVETFRDDTARAQERLRVRELEVAASTDPLTGTGNRRALEAHLSERLTALRHRGVPLGVLMMDVDWFKSLNDTYGHDVGDRALRVVAETVQHCLPGRGRVFRYGGEEFVAVVADEDLAMLGTRLCAYVEESRIVVGDEVARVTLSIGATAAEASDELAGLLRRADALLYEAKASGRNCTVTDVPTQRPF